MSGPISSLAAEAVASGPATVAPASFDGHGWLVVVNLWIMTAACALATMMVVDLARRAWARRREDRLDHPVTIWRLTALAFSAGIALRAGAEAVTIWGWDPLDPLGTAKFLVAKRLIDPVAMMCGLSGLALSYLSARGMVEQLRKRPFPIDFWASLPMLKRPAAVLFLSGVAAVGVVVTR